MRIKISYNQSPDYQVEQLIISKDGNLVTDIVTRKNIPEDNTIQRMGIVGAITQIIKAIAPDVQVDYAEMTDEE